MAAGRRRLWVARVGRSERAFSRAAERGARRTLAGEATAAVWSGVRHVAFFARAASSERRIALFVNPRSICLRCGCSFYSAAKIPTHRWAILIEEINHEAV